MQSPRTAVVVFSQRGSIRAANASLPAAAQLPAAVASQSELAAARATAHAVTAGAGAADVVLLLAGDDTTGLQRSGARVVQQEGRDFGARLVGGLRRIAALGYDRLVVVGTDTPEMTGADVARAVAAQGVVVGPSPDGGFYLLGLDAGALDALDGLPWCTAGVLAALRARLPASTELLAARRDVDCAADVRALRRVLDACSRRFLGAALHIGSLDKQRAAAADDDATIARSPTSLRPATSPQGPPAHAR